MAAIFLRSWDEIPREQTAAISGVYGLQHKTIVSSFRFLDEENMVILSANEDIVEITRFGIMVLARSLIEAQKAIYEFGDGELIVQFDQLIAQQFDIESDRAGHNSSDWTGIERRLAADPAITDKVYTLLEQARVALPRCGLTNEENAKASSIIIAVQSLLQSPQPRWKEILSLLKSPEIQSVTAIFGIIQLAISCLIGSIS